MKAKHVKAGDRIGPRRQQHWDWRAASNFIGGGAGGGLLFFAAVAALVGVDAGALVVAGMVLIATGLFCVWLEIGKPWRAMNVYRHLARSWMTREAAVAPLLFAAGAAAVFTGKPAFVVLAGLLGAAFGYSQARILSADKGIPAWRHPRCRPFVIATGFTEGVALVAVAAPALRLTVELQVGLAALLLALLLVRVLLWRSFLLGLQSARAPEGSIGALKAIDRRFLLVGHVLPAGLLLVTALGAPATGAVAAIAGALAAGAGWVAKYTLVRRAAFTQGFALKHLPVRGQARGAPAAKAGWRGAN